jgi:hypothetical protein
MKTELSEQGTKSEPKGTPRRIEEAVQAKVQEATKRLNKLNLSILKQK